MPIVDGLKEELALQKLLFTISIGLALGIISWVVSNLDRHWLLLFCSAIALCSSAVFGYTRFNRMNQLIEEIKNA